MIQKLLIANRGEIACRIIRTARDLGIATVAVYSDADARALHVEMADEAVHIGPAAVSDSYLRADAILKAARSTGADAIHPGYGFLSENPDFVDATEAAGLVFVGPSAKAIRAMGLKDRAKALMQEAGVPVVPGYHGAAQDVATLAAEADRIGYPVLVKARAGGGGKGMRLVEDPVDFADALAGAQREGQASFGDPACLIEKYIQSPRHIEMQVFGDAHGNVVHLFERDCSLQRRHQKVIEEAPAPGMSPELRQAMGDAAVAAARAVGYQGAGTVEFIVDGAGELRPDGFWFMEMNTRLQVEHPVTEAVTGLDLVALQLRVAQGEALPFAQKDLTLQGHAFEARLYAEDPETGFLPATGRLEHLAFGAARIDTGVRQGDEVTPHYDPMIAKIITHGPDRASALRQLTRALDQTRVAGCVTNRGFLQALSCDAEFAAAVMDTGLIARRGTALVGDGALSADDLAFAALAVLGPVAGEDPLQGFRHFGPARQGLILEGDPLVEVTLSRQGQRVQVDTALGRVVFDAARREGDQLHLCQNGQWRSVWAMVRGGQITVQDGPRTRRFQRHDPSVSQDAGQGDVLLSPMPGRLLQRAVTAGDKVKKGAVLMVLEAMKMEHSLIAPRDGTVAEVLAREGDQVSQAALLVRFEPQD